MKMEKIVKLRAAKKAVMGFVHCTTARAIQKLTDGSGAELNMKEKL